MSSRRRSSYIETSYTGVGAFSSAPAPHANALAAASVIGNALKANNHKPNGIEVPPLQGPRAPRKLSIVTSNSNRRNSVRHSSINNYPSSRTNSVNTANVRRASLYNIPKQRLNGQKSVPNLNSRRSVSDFTSSAKKHVPTTIKKYVPSANGLVAVEVPNPKHPDNMNTQQKQQYINSQRGSSFRRSTSMAHLPPPKKSTMANNHARNSITKHITEETKILPDGTRVISTTVEEYLNDNNDLNYEGFEDSYEDFGDNRGEVDMSVTLDEDANDAPEMTNLSTREILGKVDEAEEAKDIVEDIDENDGNFEKEANTDGLVQDIPYRSATTADLVDQLASEEDLEEKTKKIISNNEKLEEIERSNAFKSIENPVRDTVIVEEVISRPLVDNVMTFGCHQIHLQGNKLSPGLHNESTPSTSTPHSYKGEQQLTIADEPVDRVIGNNVETFTDVHDAEAHKPNATEMEATQSEISTKNKTTGLDENAEESDFIDDINVEDDSVGNYQSPNYASTQYNDEEYLEAQRKLDELVKQKEQEILQNLSQNGYPVDWNAENKVEQEYTNRSDEDINDDTVEAHADSNSDKHPVVEITEKENTPTVATTVSLLDDDAGKLVNDEDNELIQNDGRSSNGSEKGGVENIESPSNKYDISPEQVPAVEVFSSEGPDCAHEHSILDHESFDEPRVVASDTATEVDNAKLNSDATKCGDSDAQGPSSSSSEYSAVSSIVNSHASYTTTQEPSTRTNNKSMAQHLRPIVANVNRSPVYGNESGHDTTRQVCGLSKEVETLSNKSKDRTKTNTEPVEPAFIRPSLDDINIPKREPSIQAQIDKVEEEKVNTRVLGNENNSSGSINEKLVRKSALKASKNLTAYSSSQNNSAKDAYLSLETAQNTKLNAKSSLMSPTTSAGQTNARSRSRAGSAASNHAYQGAQINTGAVGGAPLAAAAVATKRHTAKPGSSSKTQSNQADKKYQRNSMLPVPSHQGSTHANVKPPNPKVEEAKRRILGNRQSKIQAKNLYELAKTRKHIDAEELLRFDDFNAPVRKSSFEKVTSRESLSESGPQSPNKNLKMSAMSLRSSGSPNYEQYERTKVTASFKSRFADNESDTDVPLQPPSVTPRVVADNSTTSLSNVEIDKPLGEKSKPNFRFNLLGKKKAAVSSDASHNLPTHSVRDNVESIGNTRKSSGFSFRGHSRKKSETKTETSPRKESKIEKFFTEQHGPNKKHEIHPLSNDYERANEVATEGTPKKSFFKKMFK